MRKALVGKFRARIVDRALHHLGIAAFDEDVGNHVAQNFSFRDREQMALALAACVFDQHVVVQPLGMRQHGCCDLDFVVESQRIDQARRRFRHGRHAVRQP